MVVEMMLRKLTLVIRSLIIVFALSNHGTDCIAAVPDPDQQVTQESLKYYFNQLKQIEYLNVDQPVDWQENRCDGVIRSSKAMFVGLVPFLGGISYGAPGSAATITAIVLGGGITLYGVTQICMRLWPNKFPKDWVPETFGTLVEAGLKARNWTLDNKDVTAMLKDAITELSGDDRPSGTINKLKFVNYVKLWEPAPIV